MTAAMKGVSQRRRTLLKGALAIGAMGALGAGAAYARPTEGPAWPKAAFHARTVEEALRQLAGPLPLTPDSEDLIIEAPAIAEHGIAHITIHARLPGTRSVSLLIPNNRFPLVAHFQFGPQLTNTITTRIQMERDGELIAVADTGDRLYSQTKKIRTTARQE